MSKLASQRAIPINPPQHEMANMSKNVSFPDVELPAESSQNGVDGFLLKYFLCIPSDAAEISLTEIKPEQK